MAKLKVVGPEEYWRRYKYPVARDPNRYLNGNIPKFKRVDMDRNESKPAIASSTVRSGVLEIGNGITQIFGNIVGLSQVIGVVNGVISIFSGFMTIRGRVRAEKKIDGVFSTPYSDDEDESGYNGGYQ